MHHLEKYTIHLNATILEALKKIDANKKGFLLVVSEANLIKGVITDGDLRRLLIIGLPLSNKIEINESFFYIDIQSGFNEICEKFKLNRINFLPIVDDSKIVNLITKNQFNAMVLESIDYSPYNDFTRFDNLIFENEIYNKPWGYYKSVMLCSFAQAKILTVFPDSELSIQSHKKREEHWIVMVGNGVVSLDSRKKNISAGDYIYIPKQCKHQIINISLENNLIISEVQLGEYFGEDDIVRYSDKYNRN
jgi:mannose-1-phosphate guanylyltransferase / mannose-6-phosphate isomerase